MTLVRYLGFGYCGELTFADILTLEQQHLLYWLHITPCRKTRGRQVAKVPEHQMARYLRRLDSDYTTALYQGLLPHDVMALSYRLNIFVLGQWCPY